jgi:hypothetical protein
VNSDRVKESGSCTFDDSSSQTDSDDSSNADHSGDSSNPGDRPSLEEGYETEAADKLNRGTELSDHYGSGSSGGGPVGGNGEVKQIDFPDDDFPDHPETSEERYKRWAQEAEERRRANEEEEARLRAAAKGNRG